MADPEKAMEVVDHSDLEDEEDETGPDAATLSSELLKNPAVVQALQGKLGSIIGTPSGYIKSLPAPVKRRLKALKKIQFESTLIEAKFYEEVHQLECKYHELYTPLFNKRTEITTGDYEPNEEECEWPSEDEDEDEDDEEEVKLAGGVKDKVNLDAKKDGDGEKKADGDQKEGEKEEDMKGVPEFWLTIFKNVDLLTEMVQEHDEPALRHLKDIKVSYKQASATEPMGFVLHFIFTPNDYFNNHVLTKEYMMKCEPSEDDPFSFEGPEIFRCKGDTIDWKKGKNLTVKVVKKKQKHKSKGNVRTITKTVKNDSFFNFFEPPQLPEDPEAEVDQETQELLTADFEIGHYIRERIVPRAVLFFTGEALEDDDYDEEEEDEEGEEEEEEEDDDDPDFDPSKVKKGAQQQECKQQ